MKIQLIETDGTNTSWDLNYITDINAAQYTLFQSDIQFQLNEQKEFDLPYNWKVVYMQPKQNDYAYSNWISGSI